MANSVGEKMTETEKDAARPSGAWWRVLIVGLVLYGLGFGILELTQNSTLFPTVVLLGNLIVPIAFVAFFYERRHLSRLSMPRTAMSFFWGGVLGVFIAGLLEPIFISKLTVGTAYIVGLIEELAKIVGVLIVARHHPHDSELNGLILGAAAGMGFAALESMGYSFNAFLQSGGAVSATVGVTLVRGVLSPVGHGAWTAILASVLFRESAFCRFRINEKVIGAYLAVVFLHGSWDALPMIINPAVGQGLDVLIGQIIVGAVGLALLALLWRQGVKRQVEHDARVEAETCEIEV